jgi:hypothetical protein
VRKIDLKCVSKEKYFHQTIGIQFCLFKIDRVAKERKSVEMDMSELLQRIEELERGIAQEKIRAAQELAQEKERAAKELAQEKSHTRELLANWNTSEQRIIRLEKTLYLPLTLYSVTFPTHLRLQSKIRRCGAPVRSTKIYCMWKFFFSDGTYFCFRRNC